MKARTKTPKEDRAACLAQQAAPKNMLLNRSYRKPAALSSLKVIIGGLLLFGNRGQKVFWPFFEATLRQYLDLRIASQSEPGQPESTIPHRHD